MLRSSEGTEEMKLEESGGLEVVNVDVGAGLTSEVVSTESMMIGVAPPTSGESSEDNSDHHYYDFSQIDDSGHRVSVDKDCDFDTGDDTEGGNRKPVTLASPPVATAGGARDFRHPAVLRSFSSAIPQSKQDRRAHGIRKFLSRPLHNNDNNHGTPGKPTAAAGTNNSPTDASSLKQSRLVASTRNFNVDDMPTTPGTRSSRSSRSYEPEIGGSQRPSDGPQYRLDPTPKSRSPGACLLNVVGFGKGGLNFYDDTSSGYEIRSNWSLSAWVIRYLHWTFRTSLFNIFLSAVVANLLICAVFGVIVYFVGKRRPSCITGFEGGYTITMMDSFSMSWQTFISTGYGNPSAAIYSDTDNCTGVNILMAFEIFIGALFGCCYGAIIFARIGRIQSFAQVLFSNPIVVRYGTGVQNKIESDADSSDATGGTFEKISCPVLEFRMVNRMYGAMGGEIMDTTLNIVASIDANQVCPSVLKAANRRRGGKKGYKRQHRQGGAKKGAKNNTANVPPTLHEDKPLTSSTVSAISSSIDSSSFGISGRFVEEDPTGRCVPRMVFCRVQVEPMDHPFFKRVWAARHVLDQDSPLLKAHARQMLLNNNGYWPRELCSHEGVRAALAFDQILVSMTGVCNIDANSVFAQKVYSYGDITIGYRFANMLYRDPKDDTLQVDLRLLNDVTEQAGGGAEPLSYYGRVKPKAVSFL